MNRFKHLLTLAIAAIALMACSDDDEPKTGNASLANTCWEARDTVVWMALDTHPLIGTYQLRLGESDFWFDVKEVAAGQPCFASDTAYLLKGTYVYEPPRLSLRSAGEAIEATVSPQGEIALPTLQNPGLKLRRADD